MNKKSFGSFMVGYLKIFGLLGLCIGVLLFILTQVAVEIPVVIGTTSYTGMTASLLLLVGPPVLLIIIGIVVSIFTYPASRK